MINGSVTQSVLLPFITLYCFLCELSGIHIQKVMSSCGRGGFMLSPDSLSLHRVTWILGTRCSATTISLMINPPVSQKTGKSTTSEYCVTCR